MLTLYGQSGGKFCDGLSRRSFLSIGALGLAGATLPQLLRAERVAGIGSSHKAIINVLLPGGPPHQDMVDLKPNAPSGIRGEFQPIGTNVPGIQICEHMPRMAKMMDKFAIIRSMVDSQGGHDLHQCLTGRPRNARGFGGGIPTMGAWVSRLYGSARIGMPAHLSLMHPTGHAQWGDPGGGGFLGRQHGPFRLARGNGSNAGLETVENMTLRDLALERLQDRHALRRSFDGFRRDLDEASNEFESLDEFEKQALGILSSSEMAKALDLSKEDPKVVERYGKPDPEWRADGAPKMTTNFLLARRLVEAGARYVSLNFSRWDWHGENFKRGRTDIPMLDQALCALVEDLHDRGMHNDVTVVCWGEFGRTPKINPKGGRDHWPKANFCILAGGGMRTGQVIGSTDKQAAEPDDRPVKFNEVFATLLQNLGIPKDQGRVFDLQSRPQFPVDSGAKPLRELV
ncbi:MAG: hypothetical protein CMI32_00115 [Opitutales bacterium]|nr:hypothetical protein [Opitutales bacterium]